MAHGGAREQSLHHVAPPELHRRLRGPHEVSGQSSQDVPDPAGLGSRRSTVSARWDGYGLHVRVPPLAQITHSHFVVLLFQKAGRLGAFLLRPVDGVYHPGGIFPDAIRAQGFSPPIIRDRAGAIRPDFSVCVESRALWQSGHRLS